MILAKAWTIKNRVKDEVTRSIRTEWVIEFPNNLKKKEKDKVKNEIRKRRNFQKRHYAKTVSDLCIRFTKTDSVF
jgi:hypothetical protein